MTMSIGEKNVNPTKNIRRLCRVTRREFLIASPVIMDFRNLLNFDLVSGNGVIAATVLFTFKTEGCVDETHVCFV